MGDGFDGPLYRAVGCAHCNHTGYAGRLGVYEAITIDDEMRRLIGDNASEDALAEAAFARADRLAASARSAVADRKSVVEGKSVSVCVDFGCRRLIKKNKNHKQYITKYPH